jgi:K+-transporting ATPase ATPase C chain
LKSFGRRTPITGAHSGGSGDRIGQRLDPHLSPDSAMVQAARVAKARGASQDQTAQLIAECAEPPSLGLLGEPRVNVLKLNLALDERFPRRP